jgi:uncharacterized SAM-binding protein YcdF (DUF218 family)
MFFYLSKIFWWLAQPLSLVTLAALLAAFLGFLGRSRAAATVAAIAFGLLFLSAYSSLGALMLQPLEDRFRRSDPPPQIAGIIVLGGGFEGAINLARRGYELNSAADRIVETAILARRYPDVPIIVSGGTGELLLEGEGDAETAPRLLVALGVERKRLILENESRNTHENAVLSYQLANPAPGEQWLLVTSAFHMPRSHALFTNAGFEVVAWPVDYRTTGAARFALFADNPVDSLQVTTLAIREWIGLLAYWLTGRIDRLFPGPGAE